MKLISASFILFIVVLTATIVPCALFFVNDDDSGASASSSSATSPIRVGAFNVRRFGKSFMKKDGVVSGLVKILQRYDIVLVQEVRDSSETSLHDLKNKLVAADGVNWDFVVSEPLGRSVHYKEQYAYFYKPSSVKVIRSYQVADSAQDVYEREPFAVDIEYRSLSQSDSSNHRVVLLGIHAKPKDVEAELRELSKTVKSVASVFPDAQAVVSLGDFNADCSYLSRTAQSGLEIFSSPDFVSLIPDDADSTVSRNTDCAYDRVVVYYRPNGKCSCDRRVFDVKGGSVFNFENFLNIEEDEARKISDHYPVEFFLY